MDNAKANIKPPHMSWETWDIECHKDMDRAVMARIASMVERGDHSGKTEDGLYMVPIAEGDPRRPYVSQIIRPYRAFLKRRKDARDLLLDMPLNERIMETRSEDRGSAVYHLVISDEEAKRFKVLSLNADHSLYIPMTHHENDRGR